MQAAKSGLQPLPQAEDDDEPVWLILVKGGQYIIPFVILVAMMVNGYSPFKASFVSILVLICARVIWTRRIDGDLFVKSARAITKGAKSMIPIAVACAAAGIIAGTLGITGLGSKISGLIIAASGGVATSILQRPNRPGVTLTNLWQCTESPAEFDGAKETVDGPIILHPPKGGSVFRIVEFEPEDPEVMKSLDGKAAFAEMGAGDNIVDDARHPFMHRTDSVDYSVILTGEITMLLDDSEVHLKAGDVVVQRGTNHAWSNRSSETCRIAFVLIDAVAKHDGG